MSLQAVQIANGANELLSEVSASKITGEEERYSHLDLVDFQANVEGSRAAFEAVAPLLEQPASWPRSSTPWPRNCRSFPPRSPRLKRRSRPSTDRGPASRGVRSSGGWPWDGGFARSLRGRRPHPTDRTRRPEHPPPEEPLASDAPWMKPDR